MQTHKRLPGVLANVDEGRASTAEHYETTLQDYELRFDELTAQQDLLKINLDNYTIRTRECILAAELSFAELQRRHGNVAVGLRLRDGQRLPAAKIQQLLNRQVSSSRTIS